jgi:hypothetical protein
MSLLKQIIEEHSDIEFLIADGFDEAVIGYDINTYRLIYSVQKCIDILIEQGMLEIDAIEYLHYNTFNAFVGESTPIWCTLEL